MDGPALHRSEESAAQRFLIVRLSALGDVVHALPLLDALRRARPRAHIAWLVEEGAADLLRDHPQLDRLWIFPRSALRTSFRAGRLAAASGTALRLVRALRAARYEVTVDAQCNLRSALLARLSGAPRRVGFAPPFAKEGAHRSLTDPVVVPDGPLLKVERNLELLKPLGIDAAGAMGRIGIPDALRVRAAQACDAADGVPTVALHPGVSRFGAFKRWSASSFAGLARRLRDTEGVRCLVTWGPGERPLAEEVVAGAEGAARIAPETGTPRELAAFLERCAVVVAADTGPLHLAAMLSVPVVALYGPKDPAVYGPWSAVGGSVQTLWGRVACSPCTLRRCDEVICMPSIGVDEVTAAVRRALSDAGVGDWRRGGATG